MFNVGELPGNYLYWILGYEPNEYQFYYFLLTIGVPVFAFMSGVLKYVPYKLLKPQL